MSTPPTAATQFFVDSWNVDHQLVAHNHMFHRELYAEVGRLLMSLNDAPFRLLDLGCGDASSFAPILRKLKLAAYDGVDLSAVALELAARNLEGLACPVQWHEADLLAYLNRTAADYDVIFSSFALHHLSPADKQAALTACRQHLAPGGPLLLIDVARDEGQALPAYLDAYCGTMAREWRSLSAEELSFAVRHVRENDLPEPASALAAMAQQAGFARCQPLARFTWHHLFMMTA